MIFSMALESANRGLTPMSFFAVYNGSGNFGVAIGATDVPGNGFLIVNRLGRNSEHEIAVLCGGETREPVWESP